MFNFEFLMIIGVRTTPLLLKACAACIDTFKIHNSKFIINKVLPC